ncbi:hypothetical protein CMV_016830 [Castanea mollissima]|uniref:phosphoserine transaminase n=1 Tax=Castanea mollissima TaxID=60419 RepID=A0A8J4QTI0_9ROSI|nr:hypothetical protein CMV_016830 [Castanea mollissima]
MCGLAFEDLLDQGGLVEVEKKNKKKTEILYNAYDGSNGFYRCPVEKSVRSLMNVPFTLEKSGLEIEFIKEAAKENMVQHKQHKSVGGASIYNAKPLTGVEKSVAFMKDFQASFGALEFVQILARGGGRSHQCREGDFWTAEIDPQTRMMPFSLSLPKFY